MPSCCRFVPAVLPMLLGLALAAHATANDKRTLVLRGRLTDAQGAPVPGARVSVQGTHQANASTDDAGQYQLTLPLGSPADLARHPVALRVAGERRGWRFELPGGAPELGLELRLVPGDGGAALCEVRSNQAGVTSAAVRALTEDGAATSVAIVSFIGTRGGAAGAAARADLPALELVALPGVSGPIAAPPATPPPPAREKEKEPEKKRNAAAPASPVPSAPTSVVTSPPHSVAGLERADTTRRAERDRSLERETARRAFDDAQKRDRLQRRTPAEDRAHAVEGQRSLGAAEQEAVRAREALDKRRETSAGSVDTTSAPAMVVPPPRPQSKAPAQPAPSAPAVALPPPRPQSEAPVQPMPSAPARVVPPPRPVPETPAQPPPAKSSDSGPAPARDTVAARPQRPASSPRPTPRSNLFPPPGGSRTRAAPLVIRAPGARPPSTVGAATGGDSCTCRVVGTVEVDSEHALPERQRVAVSLAASPAIGDTIELFMGSPRSFVLPRVPCGPQQLRIVSLGGMRYQVISRDAVFRCQRGVRYPFRVVLRPR